MSKDQDIEKIRHSLSHLLAMALLEKFPKAKLGIGPIIENGFYYDFALPAKTLTEEGLSDLGKRMYELIKQKLQFKKEIISPVAAKKLFSKQPYKLELIKELQKTKKPISIYKTAEFIDLCAGPHVKSTSEIDPNSFKLTKIAGAYWKGDEKNPMLTRIYGMAFDTKKELDDYLKIQAEIEKRDHRKLGEKLDLFSFRDIAPGAVFWHPKGMTILNELKNFIRELQKKRGYLETLTPILIKKELFEASGHWEHYRENIFSLEVDKETFTLKPMNCPVSTFIYKSKIRSYKDLPLKFSEFGQLHRKERSGTLTGLFRVYGFIQDDAHIYCRPDQILEEINGVLELLAKIHQTFGLKTSLALATKPDKAMGDPKLWTKAEKALKTGLEQNKLEYELRPKDGAFYGPKIDIDVEDSLSRKWTVATIQLDFQMPERLNLEYINEKGEKQRPVMIHRSSIGSFERFIGIILEHLSGELPLWLTPTQIEIINVGLTHRDYAKQIHSRLLENNVRASMGDENLTVGKRIREAEIQKIPYILIVGDKEITSQSVAVRKRGKGDLGIQKFEDFLKQIKEELKK